MYFLNHHSPLYYASLLLLLERSMVLDCHQCVAVLSRSKVCGCSTASGVVARMAHCLFLDCMYLFITLVLPSVVLERSLYILNHPSPLYIYISRIAFKNFQYFLKYPIKLKTTCIPILNPGVKTQTCNIHLQICYSLKIT